VGRFRYFGGGVVSTKGKQSKRKVQYDEKDVDLKRRAGTCKAIKSFANKKDLLSINENGLVRMLLKSSINRVGVPNF